MKYTKSLRHIHRRREFLKAGAFTGIALSGGSRVSALKFPDPGMTVNGGTDACPIPWLDKNGSHNQPAGPNLEPSHITVSAIHTPGLGHFGHSYYWGQIYLSQLADETGGEAYYGTAGTVQRGDPFGSNNPSRISITFQNGLACALGFWLITVNAMI